MLKNIILLFFILLPLTISAQSKNDQSYYLYNIISYTGEIKEGGINVYLDNGKSIDKLRDEKGHKIEFKTPAGALMYFLSKGWELYINGSSTEGAIISGIGASETTNYWIIRKKCSEDEFKDAVKESIK